LDGDIIVLEFGGSVLRDRSDVPAAVHEIYRWYRAGWRVVALVGRGGERCTTSWLRIELERAGIPARIIEADDIELPAPADYIGGLRTSLQYTTVLVVSGLGCGRPGASPDQRSGTDFAAVYLANALGASRCRLLKDVDGVYESDPERVGAAALLQRFSALGYADALELATTPIHPKAVGLLNECSGRAEIASLASPYESVIGRFDRTPAQHVAMSPTTVLILGLDDLGASIYERIAAMREHFHVVGIFDPDGTRRADVSDAAPLLESADTAMSQHPDIVLDTLHDLEPAYSLDSHFLERGASIVSANLALVADAGRKLNTLAARHNTYLRYNAVVGGSAPMMEALRRESHLGDLRAIAAVFSGAASHILDRWSKGFAFQELLLNASAELGESAVHEELSGTRAARKLCVLARHAFGRDPDAFRVEALDAETLARARFSLAANCALRLVARAWKISHCVFGQLQLEALDTRDPLAQVQPEWNKLLVTHRGGRQVMAQGRDGRWPTTEALMADLLDVRFARLALSTPAARTVP